MTLSSSSPRAIPRWVALVAAVGVLTLLASGIALGVNPSTQGVFELDGDAVDDTTSPADDWQNIVGQTPTGSTQTAGALVASSFVGQADGEGPTVDTSYFTGGGSKDVSDVSQWKYNGNSVPDKNQITNAYAAQYAVGGTQLVYFGADRFSNDGDSSLGFWFLRGAVTLANGNFVGSHQDGDLFIVSDFSNGGTVGTVKAYKWSGTGTSGSLVPVPGGEGGDCGNAPATANVCARVNGGDAVAPWAYTPKDNIGIPGTFPRNTFFEGGIDLSALSGGQQVCFSTFLAETRSSTSTTAQLKDFALGGFDTCEARIRISPSGVNAVGTAHNFTVSVERSFGGPFVGVGGVVVTGTTDFGTLTSSTCTTSSAAATLGTCTLTVNSSTAGVATVNASASVPLPGGANESVTTVGKTGIDGPATKRFVNATISIGPSDVNEVTDPHIFNIVVTPAAAGTTVTSISVTPSVTPTPTSQSTTCVTPGPTLQTNGTYTCSLTINSNSAGTFTAGAETTIRFTGTGTPSFADVTRSTSGAAGNSGTATKQFVNASIAISPDDTNGVGEPHTFLVTVKKDLGTGGGLVVAAGEDVNFTLTNGGSASHALNAAASTCDDAGANTNASGQCSIVFTSNTAGTVTGNASVTLSLAGVTVVRDTLTSTTTPAGPEGSGPAVKTFVAGELTWEKRAQTSTGALLGGATFEVCRTETLNSAPNPDEFVNNTPDVCVTVIDNQAPDADAIAGEFKLVGLILGKYTIRETAAPAGYALDPTTKHATLDLSDLPSSASEDVGVFVNVRLYRMIILTCNESTNTLVDSTVTLAGQPTKATLTTPPAGVTEAQLCGLGGAAYGALDEATYGPNVEIPDREPLFPVVP